MSKSFEKDFLLEVRKRQQNKIKRQFRQFMQLALILATVISFVYIFRQNSATLLHNAPYWLAFAVFFFLGFYLYRKYKNRLSLEFLQPSRLKNVKLKYILGYTVLILVLIFQANPYLLNPVSNLFVSLVYKPSPPILSSPWPWLENQKIHPVVANMPSSVETSIESVAKYIAKNEQNSYLRIKALHDYVISRVDYDLDVLKTGLRPHQDAQTVFQTHKAVCEGYANLFMALGQAIDEDIVYLTGKIRRDLAPIDLIPPVFRLVNSGYDWTLHAWNAVKVTGNWQLVDTTWDDGSYGYSTDYLMLPPKAMSASHFPEHASWQLLRDSLDYNTFEKKPILAPDFFSDNLELISPKKYFTKVEKSASIKIQTPSNYLNKLGAILIQVQEKNSDFWNLSKLLSSTKTNQKSQDKLDIKRCSSQQKAARETEIICQFPRQGDYQVMVFSAGQKFSPIAQLKFHVL